MRRPEEYPKCFDLLRMAQGFKFIYRIQECYHRFLCRLASSPIDQCIYIYARVGHSITSTFIHFQTGYELLHGRVGYQLVHIQNIEETGRGKLKCRLATECSRRECHNMCIVVDIVIVVVNANRYQCLLQ